MSLLCFLTLLHQYYLHLHMCFTLDVGCVTAPCSPHRSPYRGTLNPADHNRASLQGGSQSTPNTPKVSRPPGCTLRREGVCHGPFVVHFGILGAVALLKVYIWTPINILVISNYLWLYICLINLYILGIDYIYFKCNTCTCISCFWTVLRTVSYYILRVNNIQWVAVIAVEWPTSP